MLSELSECSWAQNINFCVLNLKTRVVCILVDLGSFLNVPRIWDRTLYVIIQVERSFFQIFLHLYNDI